MPIIKNYTHAVSDCVLQIIIDGLVVKEFLLKDTYITDTPQGFIVSDDVYTMTFDAANQLDISSDALRLLRNVCNETPVPLPLKLTFDNIDNIAPLVSDIYSVSDWNAFFDLPNFGGAFTSVEIDGNEVRLYGGGSIIIKEDLFRNNPNILIVDDLAGSVIRLNDNCFEYCTSLTSINFPNVIYGENECFYYAESLIDVNLQKIETVGYSFFEGCSSLVEISLLNLINASEYCFFKCNSLTTVNLPNLIIAGDYCFADCASLTTINLSNLTTARDSCFYECTALTTITLPSCINLGTTTGYDNVFNSISGNTITLTVPSALMTCNIGLPDGDIQYIQANNTVTIVTV